MRRWLSILLLVVMPLQLNWAAVAAYCAHEASPKASHFGHHEHAHQASLAAPDDAAHISAVAGTSAVLDIGDCHFHGPVVAALPSPLAIPVVMATGVRTVWKPLAVQAPVLAQPERPQWPHHA